ncbi:COX15/CtaA family protein [Cohnella nanjingensis]|uniref:Heme A synthase n=1 Tax=Cohnella nanjingensis TaxID=1387779 RepID=A0A7X0RRH3_9BACL|nr:COX15/CtaA family protein [Cohnella nanjingensis]MBB6670924.1 heme A synthase [Cohnella nanjingensis]
MTARKYRLLTLWTCIGMFLVLVVGVVVTNTGSGRGCGTDWPLCNGKFVPAYTLESMVEYSHRAVSGLEGLLVAATFVATWMMKPRSREATFYAGSALLFTIAQAALGAMAVVWPTSDAVLAIHFGISLIAFSSTWLLDAWAKRWVRESQAPAAAAAGKRGGADKLVPPGVFGWIVALLVYCYGVVYLGAYVRHTDSAGGCIGWPLCNGQFVPELSGATGIVFAHRLGAIVLLIAIVAIVTFIAKRTHGHRELTGIGITSIVLVVSQVFSGWLLTATIGNEDAYVFTSLLHTIIISALFSSLCLLAVRAWQLSRR